jgi:hypothetical protein
MTAADVVAALRERGVELFGSEGRLRYRGPVGALSDDLRRAAAEYRAELLALVGAPMSPPWDVAAADAELRQTLATIGAALAANWLSSAQRNLLTVFRQQGSDYFARHNPNLFGFGVWVETQLKRWQSEHDAKRMGTNKASSLRGGRGLVLGPENQSRRPLTA